MTIFKPITQHSEFQVVNFFALNTTGNKGQAVIINDSGYNLSARLLINNDLATQENILSPRWKVHTQVRPATVGERPLGITLKNTKEVNFLGSPLLYDNVRLNEADAVYSGMPVPILREGYISIGSFSGQTNMPAAGRLAVVTGQGDWRVEHMGTLPSGIITSGVFAEFLGPVDRDYCAVAYVNCYFK